MAAVGVAGENHCGTGGRIGIEHSPIRCVGHADDRVHRTQRVQLNERVIQVIEPLMSVVDADKSDACARNAHRFSSVVQIDPTQACVPILELTNVQPTGLRRGLRWPQEVLQRVLGVRCEVVI